MRAIKKKKTQESKMNGGLGWIRGLRWQEPDMRSLASIFLVYYIYRDS